MAKTNAETKIANAGGTAVETGKTAARAAAGKYSAPRLSRLALKALVDMVTSEELKPSDRLSAIKTILDYAGKLRLKIPMRSCTLCLTGLKKGSRIEHKPKTASKSKPSSP